MSKDSIFPPDFPALRTVRPAPVFDISAEVVEAIRDPLALAVYIYLRSNLHRPRLRQLESVMDHFGLTVDEADNAYAELKRVGVTCGFDA